jgi:tetratricopeptide (TPR) repeat protein
LGAIEEAREAYAKAVDLVPDHASYRLNLASALAREGTPEAAVPHLVRALAGAPELRSLLPGFPEFGTILDDTRLAARDKEGR